MALCQRGVHRCQFYTFAGQRQIPLALGRLGCPIADSPDAGNCNQSVTQMHCCGYLNLL